MKTLYRKKLELPKVSKNQIDNYYTSTSKICPVEIEIELREQAKGPELSICGTVWRSSARRTAHRGGQCIDEIARLYPANTKVQRIKEIWKHWHLNGLNAGTPEQMAFINEWKKTHEYDYGDACKALQEAGLYEVRGIKYGYTWQYEPIPDEIIDEIKSW